jgi:putative ABC transport system permease protein
VPSVPTAARGSRWLALAALRHRGAQSVVLLLLSVIAIAACAAGPMYQRAVEQAAVRSQLGQVSAADRGVTISASSATEAASYLPTGAERSLFGTPVAGLQTTVAAAAPRSEFNASVVGRDDICAHLVLVAGRCPSGGQQLLASTSSASALHLAVGDSVRLTGLGGSAQYRIGTMRIAGLYKPFDSAGNYWFDRPYSSTAGVRRVPRGDAVPDLLVGDALFVTPAGVDFLRAAEAAAKPGGSSPFEHLIDLPVSATDIGIDQSHRLLAAIDAIDARMAAAHPDGDPLRGHVTSKLAGLLHTADTGRRQTRVIIPTLAVQLALVVLVVLGLVLAVGVDQRRAEIGLARLRGQSRQAAGRRFVAEIAVLVLAAIVPGILLGWLGCLLLARWWLPAGTPVELRWPVLAAGLAVAGVALLLAVGLARRAASRPIGQLLRSVSMPGPAGRISAAEAGLAVAAVAGVVVALTGNRSNAVSLFTPSMLAILAGLLLSRLLLLVSRRLGSRALWRGRITLALAAFEIARRPGTRRVVTLVCVAVALLVSAVDEQSVAAANRDARAAASVGAPVVLDVQPASAAQLRSAVAGFDPAGNYAMAVITQRPDGGDTPVAAVDSHRLGRIARWGSDRDTPSQQLIDRLRPVDAPAPIRLTGSRLQLRTAESSVRTADPGSSDRPQPVTLVLRLQLPDGAFTTADLPIRNRPAESTSTALLGGCARGCTLSRIEVARAIGDFTSADVSIRLLGLSAGQPGALRPVSLGNARDWQNSEAAAAAAGTAASIAFEPGPQGSLVLHAVSHGTGATLQHLDVPVNLPCLPAGSGSDGSAGEAGTGQDVGGQTSGQGLGGQGVGAISMHGIDGESAQCQPVGDIAFLPRLGAGVLVTDLDLAISSAQPVLTNSTASIWLGRNDPVRERALTVALASAGIPVLGRSTISHQRSGYDRSPPAWAIRAALAAAVLAAMIAALMVVIAAYTSQRARSYDLAALRLVGLRRSMIRRGVLAEQLSAVSFAVIVGALVGLLGARLSLPALPLFVDPPAVPRPRYDTAWLPVTVATGAVLLALLGAGVAAALVIGRGLHPDRLREGD